MRPIPEVMRKLISHISKVWTGKYHMCVKSIHCVYFRVKPHPKWCIFATVAEVWKELHVIELQFNNQNAGQFPGLPHWLHSASLASDPSVNPNSWESKGANSRLLGGGGRSYQPIFWIPSCTDEQWGAIHYHVPGWSAPLLPQDICYAMCSKASGASENDEQHW